MQGISKTFNGLRVLKNVSLKVYPGEIHALMGKNGAGKCTLMKILSGAYQADPGGTIRIAGQPVATFDPATAKALGIAVIYQELSLCPNLSVAENIYLGRGTAPWLDHRPPGHAGRLRGSAATPGCRVHRGDAGQQPARLPNANWWKSPAPCMPTPRSWSWTSPPRRSHRARPTACSR